MYYIDPDRAVGAVWAGGTPRRPFPDSPRRGWTADGSKPRQALGLAMGRTRRSPDGAEPGDAGAPEQVCRSGAPLRATHPVHNLVLHLISRRRGSRYAVDPLLGNPTERCLRVLVTTWWFGSRPSTRPPKNRASGDHREWRCPGGGVARDGRALVWTMDRVLAYEPLLAHGETACEGLVRHPLAAGFGATPNTIEILTDDSLSVGLLRQRGPLCQRVATLPSPAGLVPRQGLRNGLDWVVLFAGRDSTRPPLLVRWDGGSPEVLSGEWPEAAVQHGGWLWLSGADSDLVIGSGEEPYEWWTVRLAPGGLAWSAPRRPAVAIGLAAAAANGLSVGLPVVPIEGGFLQTFADLRSDERLLAVYDRTGSTRRTSRLTAPFGIVATAPHERLVLATARPGQPKVILYRLTGGSPTTATRE